MEWMPAFQLTLLGGWLPLLISSSIQWGLLFSMPRDVFKRIFDRSGWGKKQRIFFRLGKLCSVVCLVLIIFTPLKLHSPCLFVGGCLYLLGWLGLIVSILNYRDTPLDQPVTRGLYRISRHPQIVSTTLIALGICLAVGSWLAVSILAVAKVLEHYGILAEEEACLKQYGESYRSFMERVPRYFLFF